MGETPVGATFISTSQNWAFMVNVNFLLWVLKTPSRKDAYVYNIRERKFCYIMLESHEIDNKISIFTTALLRIIESYFLPICKIFMSIEHCVVTQRSVICSIILNGGHGTQQRLPLSIHALGDMEYVIKTSSIWHSGQMYLWLFCIWEWTSVKVYCLYTYMKHIIIYHTL